MTGHAGVQHGTRPYGAYLLCEELGRGGMAVVYRAISQKPDSFGRVVALKQLLARNEFDVDFDQVRSFIEEARLATRFHHPNIANTYSLGKVDGAYFIEMEYVPGPTLFEIAQQTEITGAVPVSFVAQILIQICDALEHVHGMCDDQGVSLDLVHRDVSLSNIMVGDDGTAKLIDFGIVKGHSCTQTKAGMIKGKPAYVAPEYLAGALDRRADLYALGVIAHELLTGRRLFVGKNDLDTITRICQLRVPLPSRSRPDVPPALDAIVMRALERDPEVRWQTAADMRAALVAEYGAGDPLVVRDWLRWAFGDQPPAKLSQLVRVIDSFDHIAEPVDLAATTSGIEIDLEPDEPDEPGEPDEPDKADEIDQGVERQVLPPFARRHGYMLAGLACALSAIVLATSYVV